MNEQIRKVRKSIKHRKKFPTSIEETPLTHLPTLPSNEERLGMIESTPSSISTANHKQTKKTGRMDRFKYFIFPFVFFIIGVFILSTPHSSFQSTQTWLHKQLETEFPFAKMNAWFVSSFGQPNSLIPTSRINEVSQYPMPIEGDIVETFAVNGNGIKIATDDETTVTAFSDGIVIFVGNLKDTGKTVIVQHSDETVSTYGFLSDIHVFAYQMVNETSTIGRLNPNKSSEPFFFALQKDNEYIDPAKVIRVDDLP